MARAPRTSIARPPTGARPAAPAWTAEVVAAAVPEAVPEAEAVPLLARVEVTTTLLAEGDAVTVTAVVLATEGMLAGGTEEAAEAAEEAAAEEEAEAEADMPEPAEAAAQSLSEAGRTWSVEKVRLVF